MIKNSVPVSTIPLLTQAQKQDHMIGLFTSIDQTLKKLLLWSEPSAGAGMIEKQYEMAFGVEVESDLADFFGQVEAEKAVEAPAKAVKAPAKAVKAPAKAVAEGQASAPAEVVVTVAPEETTLASAPDAVAAVAVAAPVAVVDAEFSIEDVRKAAQKLIVALTAKGQNGKEVFAKLLRGENSTGVYSKAMADDKTQVLTALKKEHYSTLIAEISKLVPAEAVAAFDPLA